MVSAWNFQEKTSMVLRKIKALPVLHEMSKKKWYRRFRPKKFWKYVPKITWQQGKVAWLKYLKVPLLWSTPFFISRPLKLLLCSKKGGSMNLLSHRIEWGHKNGQNWPLSSKDAFFNACLAKLDKKKLLLYNWNCQNYSNNLMKRSWFD